MRDKRTWIIPKDKFQRPESGNKQLVGNAEQMAARGRVETVISLQILQL